MSTALAVRPSLLARISTVLGLSRAAVNVNNDFSSTGWTIIRGTQPTDFQGKGEEVKRVGWERHPVVQACIRCITELIAAVPLEIYKRDATGDATVLPNHEALAVFRGEGGRQSEYRWKALSVTHFLTYGNAFSVIERTGRMGLPTGLRIVTPDRVQYAWLDGNDQIAAYDWRDLQSAVHSRTPATEIVHFRDLDAADGLFGFPRMASALRSILADSEAGEYVRQVVTNHGSPGMAVMLEGSPTPEDVEAGRQRWQEKYVNRGGRGGVAFMVGVKDLKPIGFDLNQLEFPDLRRVTREDICTAANVDPRIIGIASATKDGGLSGEQYREARFRLIQQTVYPVMRALEDELNFWLMPEFGDVYVRFSEEYIAAITEDITETSTRVIAEVTAKIRTVEEAREAVGLEAEMDAKHTMPGGMTVGDTAANAQALGVAAVEAAKNPAPAPGDAPPDTARMALTRALGMSPVDHDAMWRSFDETARKQEGPYERTALLLFAAEAKDIAQIMAALELAHAAADDVFIAEALRRIEANYAPGAAYHRAWLDRYTKLISQSVQVGGSDVAARIGINFQLENPRAQAVIRHRAADLVTNVTETTKGQIRDAILSGHTDGLDISQIAQRIEDATFGEISASRALTIARTETVGALNAGAYQAAVQSGVMRSKTWVTQKDDNVRDSHAAIDGDTIDIGAAFANGMRYPHEPGAPADEVINCRCSLNYSDLDAGAMP